MRNKKNRIILFGALFFLSVSFQVSAEEEICLKNVENLRSGALTSLHRFEEHFRNAGWSFLKYQEIVYEPVWQAVLKRRDSLSGNYRQEGELLYQRYRVLADQERLHGEEELALAVNEFKAIDKGLAHEDSCGASLISDMPEENISLFNNCMEVWNSETGNLLKELEVLLEGYQKQQKYFSEKVEARADDTRSDHDAFQDRFRDYFLDYDLKTRVEFLSLVRQIREKFELKWPAETCCERCHEDQRLHWDPVFSQVRLDPQGSLGVGGNVTNNARLGPAFERLKEEQRKEKEENAPS